MRGGSLKMDSVSELVLSNLKFLKMMFLTWRLFGWYVNVKGILFSFWLSRFLSRLMLVSMCRKVVIGLWANMVGQLLEENKDKLPINLLFNGRGSLDLWRVRSGAIRKSKWCVCESCRPMQTLDENKCHGKCGRVTSYEVFPNICSDREVVTLVSGWYTQLWNEQFPKSWL